MKLADLHTTLVSSMKKGDTVAVETLRFLISDIKNLAINKYGAESEAKLTEKDIEDVVKKQVKTHKESIEAFTKAGRAELAEKEQAQLAILEAYLPKQMSDEELMVLLKPIVDAGGDPPIGEASFGPMMGKAMAMVKGQADGGRVSAILKQLLEHRTQ
jgi:uncharacterized protein